MQTHYSDEIKDRAVRLTLESGRPTSLVAKDLGVHETTLRRWIRQARADKEDCLGLLTTDEHKQLKELKREVLQLRKANEILKAASVFFATELDPTRPK